MTETDDLATLAALIEKEVADGASYVALHREDCPYVVKVLRAYPKLVAALGPFAAFLDAFQHLRGPGGYHDGAIWSVQSSVGGEREITGADLQRARATIQEAGQ